MNLNADLVKDLAPETTSIDNVRINRFIEYAKLQVNRSVFTKNYEIAVAYLAAHMLSVSPESGSSITEQTQIVTSSKVGDLSRTYQNNQSTAMDSTSLSRTRYGTEFLRIRNTCLISPMVL